MAAANGDSATNGDDGVSQTEPDSNSPASDQQTDQQPNQPISGKQRSVSTLRWWPGLLLLLAMPLLRAIPSMMDSPSLPVMMMGFMGPIAVGALLLVWWCFASRASIKEKTLGTIAFVAIAVIADLHAAMRFAYHFGRRYVRRPGHRRRQCVCDRNR